MLGAITATTVFQGFVQGLCFALIAMGVVLIYRSSRIINFAVGSIGIPAAAALALFVSRSHWPYYLGLVFALLVGTASGTVVELVVIRRLFKAPRVIVLVATLGVAELAQAVMLTLPDYHTGEFSSQYPVPSTAQWRVGNVDITGPQLFVILTVPVVLLGLWWLLTRTKFADSIRAAATNADLARLTGISPKLMSTAIWTIAGFLSTLSVILYAGQLNGVQLNTIGPNTLLAGLAAALIGRMRSFPLAALGGIAIGVVQQTLFFYFSGPNDTGLTTFVLFIVVLLLVARTRRSDDAGAESFSFAPRVPAIPERLREIWWVRNLPRLLGAFCLLIAILVPLALSAPSHHQTYAVILAFAICGLSVTVLTGWAGQLSLGQMAFAGLGALSAIALERGITLNVGFRSTRIMQGSVRPGYLLLGVLAALVGLILVSMFLRSRRKAPLVAGIVLLVAAVVAFGGTMDASATPHSLPFGLTLIAGAVIACLAAVLVGLGALRVRGLLLAISTMAFAVACRDYIFQRRIFDKEGSGVASYNRGKLGPVDLSLHHRAYYWFVLAILVVTLVLVGHLRRTGIGRMIVGVRENEANAAALTVSPMRAKLTSFAVAGFVAGLGGALLAGVVLDVGYHDQFFRFEDSLTLVGLAAIGGLGSIAGPVVGALWVIGLPAFWPKNQTVPLFTSSIGLLIILLYLPGGFTQLGYWLRGMLFRWLERRLPERPAKTMSAPPPALTRPNTEAAVLNDDGSVLATKQLCVVFGGLTAVDNVDFFAKPGELVGLIGTNGAGKSTLLNAIGGFVPSTGEVSLLGRDVAKLPPNRRAERGLGRTFQAATLFPELTVRETVQLALEARGRTSFWGSLVNPWYTTRVERARRAEAAELVDYLGLGRYADRFVAELSTGTRRIVELTTVLAVGARVICLDEPTAGVAQREAEAFGPLIKRVQAELDATLIVVEHDLPLIMSISDRIYCLEAGAVIAAGPPDEVRNNPRVVSSYLGTDDRAIQRSNA